MKYMERVFDTAFYTMCFFLLAGAIYRLAFLVPPRPWEPGYESFKAGAALTAFFVSGMMVLFSVMTEFFQRRYNRHTEE